MVSQKLLIRFVKLGGSCHLNGTQVDRMFICLLNVVSFGRLEPPKAPFSRRSRSSRAKVRLIDVVVEYSSVGQNLRPMPRSDLKFGGFFVSLLVRSWKAVWVGRSK